MKYIPLTIALLLAGCDSATQIASTESLSVSIDNIKATDYAAHWLNQETVLIDKSYSQSSYFLVSKVSNNWQKAKLTKAALLKELQQKHPHLIEFDAFHVELTDQQSKAWLKNAIYIAKANSDEKLEAVSKVQTGFVLDDIFTSGTNDANEQTDYGATLIDNTTQFKLWAPTAQQVNVLLFNQDKTPYSTAQLAMVEDTATGTWQAKTQEDLSGKYYQYQLDVYHPATGQIEQIVTTDPYSLSLSTNSVYSQVISLDSPETQPDGWLDQQVPTIAQPEDAIFYEMHIRDFSAIEKNLSNQKHLGKYLAFTEQNSDGIKHLKTLKESGLTHIHLLPAFDIGTVNEAQNISLTNTIAEACGIAPKLSLCSSETDKQQTLYQVLEIYAVASDKAQALVDEIKTFDNYNWGYDPFHYTVPEGSYAVNPDGVSRIIEFRQMVQSIHNMGFRVIMDVVYNHTHQAQLEKTAVLDKIVPNYYQRLNPFTGQIEQSTCCDNTATERVMMAKLMTDSLVVWAKDYKIDGFRFDLMGHQPKDAMLAAREAVHQVDADNYFYGEGWNFGEVANHSRFTQASQTALAGTEIGTFSDRLRDAVRGPGISVQGDDIRRAQGIGNGLYIQPNDLNKDALNKEQYLLLMDQIRVGLAGNLATFPLENAKGEQVLGKDIPYGDQPTGYALDPADTITYVSKHDNQTLWDNNQYRNPYQLTTEQRVRLHNQSLSYVMLAQGIPFIHMGSELLRSKSYLRDSYDYGDWYNRVDFSKQQNFYNVGLPPQDKDKANWPLIGNVISSNEGKDKVSSQDIVFASQVFNEFLKIRTSGEFFTLGSAEEINQQLRFLNTGSQQQLGLIAMQIKENSQTNNSAFSELVVIFNSSPKQQVFEFKDAKQFQLHPVQASGVDLITQQSKTEENSFVVPALTTAVFVKLKG